MTITSVIQYTTEYQVTYANGTIAFVPIDPNNSDYMHVQKWVAAGGVITIGATS